MHHHLFVPAEEHEAALYKPAHLQITEFNGWAFCIIRNVHLPVCRRHYNRFLFYRFNFRPKACFIYEPVQPGRTGNRRDHRLLYDPAKNAHPVNMGAGISIIADLS